MRYADAWEPRAGYGSTAGRLDRNPGFYAGLRRQVASKTMAALLDHGPRCRRRNVCLQSYQSMGASFLQIWTAGPELRSQVTVLNPSVYELTRLRYGTGLTMVSCHLGSWDALISRFSDADPEGQVLCAAKRQKLPKLDALLNECRSRMGMRIVLLQRKRNDVLLQAIRALRAQRPVGLLSDQRPGKSVGSEGYFLGRKTHIHIGAAMAAKKLIAQSSPDSPTARPAAT